ncbi:MAG TPA: hypothetical protein VMR21_03185 [Vicinamibacteria bacterium]|nr:hypothetical protein [Vicinamibacteria bacterium]
MTFGGRSRRTGLLVLLVFASAWATRGMCAMAGTAGAGPRGAHDCCKQGWQAAPPGCCMTGPAEEAPALVGGPVSIIPTLAASLGVVIPIVESASGGAVAPADRTHSPPLPSVLRI